MYLNNVQNVYFILRIQKKVSHLSNNFNVRERITGRKGDRFRRWIIYQVGQSPSYWYG